MEWRTRHAWALGQPGMETRVSEEIGRALPGARCVAAGGGLVRVESPVELGLDWAPELIFARSCGLELGADEAARAACGRRPHLQVWKRRDGMPGARLDPGFERGRLRMESESRARLEAEGVELAPPGEAPQEGELVLTVLWAAKDSVIHGLHVHRADRLPYPGAEYPWPEREIPSRAYVKAREALEWSRAPLARGERVLELGCAPGGATLALLERGASVIGVDVAPMNARFERGRAELGGEFTQVFKRAEELEEADLPERVDWLVSDMNVDSDDLLAWVGRWWPELRRRGARGAVLTVKAASEGFWETVPGLGEGLRGELNVERVVLKQLSQHRREVLCLVQARAWGGAILPAAAAMGQNRSGLPDSSRPS